MTHMDFRPENQRMAILQHKEAKDKEICDEANQKSDDGLKIIMNSVTAQTEAAEDVFQSEKSKEESIFQAAKRKEEKIAQAEKEKINYIKIAEQNRNKLYQARLMSNAEACNKALEDCGYANEPNPLAGDAEDEAVIEYSYSDE